MTLDFGAVNWLAVIVGTAIYFVLGALWYAPFFLGKRWQRSIGWDESRQMEASPMTYVAPALIYLVSGAATGLLAVATGTDTLAEGITLGLVVGIGYALVITATDAVFDPMKPEKWTWFAISGGYHVIGLLIVAVVIAIWP